MLTAVVPTRGRPDKLRDATRAIVQQDYPGVIECIVVFDQQDPDELRLDLPPNRELRLLVNERAAGPAGARNTGMLAARGELIALCDDDDSWAPDKITAQVSELRAHPGALVVGCGIELTAGRRTFRRLPPVEVGMADLVQERQTALHTSSLLFPASALRSVGLFDESIPAGYGEDYDWLHRAVAVGPLRTVRRLLVRVSMDGSWFADRWAMLADSLMWQLSHRPDLFAAPRNSSRVRGRVAFALAASGQRARSRAWARQSIRDDWRQPRGYLALLVSHRLLSPRPVLWVARTVGRGI